MRNTLKTFALMAGMTAMFGGAGMVLAGTGGMAVALGVAGVMNLASWWFADKIILGLYGADEVKQGRAYDITRELATRARMPMPRVCLVKTAQPNAFATGRTPQKGVVAVTTGLLDILDDRELRGVIAHELAHIKNRDTLTMTLTATMAGGLSMLAWGIGGRRGNNPLATLAVMAVALVVAPLVQLAVSRTREYAADRAGAEISGDPEALAQALLKLETAARTAPNKTAEQNPATAHMFIINPLPRKSGGSDSFFSTHPRTANRVQELYNFAAEKKMPVSERNAAVDPLFGTGNSRS